MTDHQSEGLRNALEDFAGTTRFQVLRELGSGGAGIVYEAFDRERNTNVAIKKLSDLSPDSLFRFKREFREFRDLTHPNLIALHELHCERGVWFFSMEFIAGVDFVHWVRPEGVLDEARLRDGLAQLTFGLLALHGAGKLHRDVKPSNIMVAPDGRVVLLDFGIAGDTARRSTGAVFGTVAYMAPEQAAGEVLRPPADWYAVGVLLFEALTGQLPYSGSVYEILLNKINLPHPQPRSLVPSLPEDLNQLCGELLAAAPAARPTGQMILERLARQQPESGHASTDFVGRQAELAELEGHFMASRLELRALAVVGDSGVGKTSLLRFFADLMARREPTLVLLSSSCHERELLPFQAVDGLMDCLSSYLRHQPAEQIAPLLPQRVGLIRQAFPVLGRVEAIAAAPTAPALVPDVRERRDMLFAALRELLTRLALRSPLMLLVDDVQWADSDSVAFLSSLLRDAPPLLFVASLRSDIAGPPGLIGKLHALPLHRLGPSDAEVLTEHLARRSGSRESLDVARIAAESGGHPLFIDVLVRQAAQQTMLALPLDEAFAAEIRALEQAPRALLRLCAIAVGPISAELAARTLELDTGGLQASIGELRRARLLRVVAGGRLEPYHARVRAAALASINAEAYRPLHARLALALEATQAEPEPLTHHYLQAEQLEAAAHHAERAARKARAALAFERAVEFYGLCLQLTPDPSSELLGQHAEALAQAGHGEKAGQAYLRAADRADAPAGQEFRRRAADQLLRSGHVDEGIATLNGLLRAAHVTLPKSPRAAFWALVLARLRLRLRGLGIRERTVDQIPPVLLARVDLLFAAGLGLAFIDPIVGANFQTRFLLLALGAGEPARVVQGLCLEATMISVAGSRTRKRSDQMFARARVLVERLGDPRSLGMYTMCCGAAALLRGEWESARRQCQEAERILSEQCANVSWELASARFCGLAPTYWTGDMPSLRRVPALIAESEARGDLFASVNFRTVLMPLLELFDDAPERARAQAEAGLAMWSRRGFHIQHMNAALILSEIDLYEGRVAQSLERLQRTQRDFGRSHLHRFQLLRIWSQHVWGIAALHAGERAMTLRSVRSLEREGAPWAHALAALLRAGVDADQPDAASRWRNAAELLAASDVAIPAACAGWRAGDPSGEAALIARGVRNPAAILKLFAPCLARA